VYERAADGVVRGGGAPAAELETAAPDGLDEGHPRVGVAADALAEHGEAVVPARAAEVPERVRAERWNQVPTGHLPGRLLRPRRDGRVGGGQVLDLEAP